MIVPRKHGNCRIERSHQTLGDVLAGGQLGTVTKKAADRRQGSSTSFQRHLAIAHSSESVFVVLNGWS